MSSSRLSRPVVNLALVLLMLYIWAGWSLVPFHGDEADHLFKSRDFLTYVIKGHPDQLLVTPPVQIDSPEHIRLLTGTASAYWTGLILWLGGVYNWPPPWYYAYPVQWNINNGRWPSLTVLYLGRMAMTFLSMLSVPLAYNIVWLMGRRHWPALVAAALIATHPAWLLNSRRVMQEAALGSLSLAVVWLGMLNARRVTPPRWLWLGVMCGLCLAAKPTGVISVGAVLLTLWLTTAPRWRWLSAGIVSLAVYLLLTPAIWGAPLPRVVLAVELRAEVLQGQTRASPDAHQHWSERALALIQQPFLSKVQYYESDAFADVPRLDAQITRYQASGLAGWQMPPMMGWGATALVGFGLLNLWRRNHDPAARVLLAWMLLTALALALSVPLAWQRYYLVWSLAACLAIGVSLCGWNRS